jgi:hypothetical protein
MNYQISYPESKLDKIMTLEQFEQVVEAILAGKYSWACLLILRFGGYNPLHYIPYRTYNRLMKENRQGGLQQNGHRLNSNNDSEVMDKHLNQNSIKSQLRQPYGQAIKDQMLGTATRCDL